MGVAILFFLSLFFVFFSPPEAGHNPPNWFYNTLMGRSVRFWKAQVERKLHRLVLLG